MKVLKSIIVLILLLSMTTISAQPNSKKWKQLVEFNDLLKKTFAPCEEGDFSQIKIYSQDLVAKSEALDISTMPKEINAVYIQETLKRLIKQTKIVNELVNCNAPKAEILMPFQDLYDLYNRLVLLCNRRKY